MGLSLPSYVEDALEGALVCLFTTVNERGEPVTHPMLPLYRCGSGIIYFTSSILFSRKLEHIKKNPRVSLLFPGGELSRSDIRDIVQVKGLASVKDEDLHDGWTFLLPLWRAKEPYIDRYLKQRFALPLFWERAAIEVRPVKLSVWREGDLSREPEEIEVGEGRP